MTPPLPSGQARRPAAERDDGRVTLLAHAVDATALPNRGLIPDGP